VDNIKDVAFLKEIKQKIKLNQASSQGGLF